MGYSIKVIKDQEFERLPYKYADQAFAITSPDRKNIYVRHTKLHDFNKILISHELDHIVEDYPTDEGPNGERYFSLGGLFSGLGSGLLSGFTGLGSSLAKTFFNTSQPSNLIQGATRGIASSFGGGNALAAPSQGYGQVTPQTPSGGGFFNKLLGGVGSLFKSGSPLGGILGLFKQPQTQLGAGLLGLGLSKSLPKVPPLPPSVDQLRGMVQAGGTPLGQQAQGVISGNLNQQFNPLTDPEITAATSELDRSKLQDVKRLEDLYASVRPGTDYTTDTTYKQDLANIERQYAESKANEVAGRTRTAQEYFNQNQYRNVQAALGASDQQMSQLAQLAQLDVDRIMAQLGIDYQSALNFKQTFQSLGGQLLLSGLNSANPFSLFNATGG